MRHARHSVQDNDGVHIVNITNSTDCRKHGSEKGKACWYIWPGSSYGRPLPAICGARVKRAGFNGAVSASSVKRRSGIMLESQTPSATLPK